MLEENKCVFKMNYQHLYKKWNFLNHHIREQVQLFYNFILGGLWWLSGRAPGYKSCDPQFKSRAIPTVPKKFPGYCKVAG